MKLFDLKNKNALITGSSHGLGFSIAEGLGMAGAHVILNGRDTKRLESARKRLEQKHVETSACAFDVTIEEDVIEAVARVEKDVGPIHILVNNAGMTLRGLAEELPSEQWREVMQLNLDAVFYVSKAVGQRMIRRMRGKVINIGSLMCEGARPTTAAYAASKGGVTMLTKALAVEWAKHNIQVNAIGPGYFVTELTESLVKDRKFDAWVRSRTPAGRWGDPSDLAGAAVFLSSAASDFITGQTIYVDGGWLAAL